MSVKLTDAQLVMLSAASQHGELCLTAPVKMKGAILTKVSEKLVKLGLVREIRAKTGMPVWRRDEAGQSYALKLTAAGLKAIAVGDGSEAAIAPREAPQSRPSPDTSSASGPGTIDEHAQTLTPRAGSKLARVIDLLQRPEGATIPSLTEATGWRTRHGRVLPDCASAGTWSSASGPVGEIRSTASQGPPRPEQIASSSSPQRPRVTTARSRRTRIEPRDRHGAQASRVPTTSEATGEDSARGVVKVTGLRRHVARHALLRAIIYAARARHSANAAERLCLYSWRVTRCRS